MSSRRNLLMVIACVVALSGAACSGSGNGSPAAAASPNTRSVPPQTTPLGATGETTVAPQSAAVTTPGRVSACALITRDEAGAARGIPVPEGKERTDLNPFGPGASSYCAYGGEVSIFWADLGNGAANTFAQYRTAKNSESDYQELSGMGDEAFVAGANLTIRVGSSALVINVGQNTNTVANHLEKEKGLAVIALGRL